MKIGRAAWDTQERQEYEAVLAEVVAATSNTHERLDLFEAKLADAIQAQRPWAREVERACLREGLAREVKRHQDRHRAWVSHNGEVLSLPKVQSATVRTETGEVYHQRSLIEYWPWDQVEEKRAEALRALGHDRARVAYYDRLLALRGLSPESTSAADAAKQLGINLDEFLGLEAAA